MLAQAPRVGGKSPHRLPLPFPRFKDTSNTEHQKSNTDPPTLSTTSVLALLPSPLHVLLHSILRTTCSYAHSTDKETEARSRSHSSWRQSRDSNKICFRCSEMCQEMPKLVSEGTGEAGDIPEMQLLGPRQLRGRGAHFWQMPFFKRLCVVSFTFHNSSMKQVIIFPFHR